MTNITSSKRRRRMARESKPEADGGEEVASTAEIAAKEKAIPAPQREPSKIDKVLVLLKRPTGATLDELVEATGWLPHTIRAALTGLKKKGYVIERTKVEGVSRYTIAEAAAQ